MEAQLGAAKVAKYATGESGDTLEIIERPHGGISAVLVDGQRSGRSAKIISNIVARKAISLLGEGVRDGAVARASHDYLRTHRRGQVSAELQIVSVDLETRTLVVSRNSHCPALLLRQGDLVMLDEASEAIGFRARTKPVITEIPLEPGLCVAIYTDGLLDALTKGVGMKGLRSAFVECAERGCSAQGMADALLEASLKADSRRPGDDTCAVVMSIRDGDVPDDVRRLSFSFPV